jgi:hypothetical protein
MRWYQSTAHISPPTKISDWIAPPCPLVCSQLLRESVGFIQGLPPELAHAEWWRKQSWSGFWCRCCHSRRKGGQEGQVTSARTTQIYAPPTREGWRHCREQCSQEQTPFFLFVPFCFSFGRYLVIFEYHWKALANTLCLYYVIRTMIGEAIFFSTLLHLFQERLLLHFITRVAVGPFWRWIWSRTIFSRRSPTVRLWIHLDSEMSINMRLVLTHPSFSFFSPTNSKQDQVRLLDLEYVHLNVNKVLALLTKTFINR